MKGEKVTYYDLLGMTELGRTYLNRYKKTSLSLSFLNDASFSHPFIRIDSKAARIYAIGLPEKYKQKAIELEYIQQPIYVKTKIINHYDKH